jgi:hypothetical protein
MTQLTNGHSNESIAGHSIEEAIEGLQAMTAKSATVVERVPNDGTVPFEQKAHDLMIESVDRITTQWVDELVTVRDNTKTIEQMVIEQAAKVKDELTRLHLLGARAMGEARRGHEVLSRLGEELDAMMATRAA